MVAASAREDRCRPLRVLVIEDNRDGRETLRTLLELLGHQVETAADGLEGLNRALAWRPDVAVVDIGLPRLDGYQVARQIRASLGRRIVLLAHTGYGRQEDRREALLAGFDAHLVKPMSLDELSYWLAVASCGFGGAGEGERPAGCNLPFPSAGPALQAKAASA